MSAVPAPSASRSSSSRSSSARRAWAMVASPSPRARAPVRRGRSRPRSGASASSCSLTATMPAGRPPSVLGHLVDPALGVPQSCLDPARPRRWPSIEPANAMQSTGRLRTTSSGSASSQPRSSGSCRSRRSHRQAQLHQVGSPLDVAAGHARGGSPRRARRCRRTTGWPGGAAPARARAARPAAAPAGRRRTGGGSGTSGAGRPAARGTGCRAPDVCSIALPPAAPVTASHSGAAQPAQDRGVQQEVLDDLRLALHDLLDEVVDDVPVVTGEAGDELGCVVASLHRQCGQLESGDPALGAARRARRRRRRSGPDPWPR